MSTISRYLAMLNGRQDMVLALMLMLAVFMMILPLPTALVDLLIATNLTFSIILLMIAIYTREPLEFSSFPAVLLITTLYRLSLSISTTRLILLQHDAGEIVYLFGNFVVGGNLAVGLIIFTIITIVQFIVITKGSERVAEVGARFSLDAMPGKQMSIDGDMRAGTIDAREAKRQRAMVQKESQLYGAMDGAMKFVKGDAIASIIVILVNIFGGVAVGVFQHGMAASEALNTYAVLSVGDGLISQIPALLISITAGIIVTRVPGEKPQNLAIDLAQQLGRQPQPLMVAGGVLLLFGLFPGFPSAIFLPMATVLVGGGYSIRRRLRRLAEDSAHQKGADGAAVEESPGSIPLVLSITSDLSTPNLNSAIDKLQFDFFEQQGIPLPKVELRVVKGELGGLSILLYQEPVLAIKVAVDQLLVESHGAEPSVPHQQVVLPFGTTYLYWVDQKEKGNLSEQKVQFYSAEERIIRLLSLVVQHYAKEFIGIQETRFLMDGMEHKYSELVKELQRQMQLARIADVLQRLVEEQISIRDLRTIFESLITWATKEKDVVILTEYVRIAMRRHIIGRYCNEQRKIEGWLIGRTVEGIIRESIRQTSAGSYSALEPRQTTAILQKIKETIGERKEAILFTALDVRRYLRKIVERELFDVRVLSYQELGDEVELEILGNIEILDEI